MSLIDIFLLLFGLFGATVAILIFAGFAGGVLFRFRISHGLNNAAAALLIIALGTMLVARVGDLLAWPQGHEAKPGKETQLAYLPDSAQNLGSAAKSAKKSGKSAGPAPVDVMLASADVGLGKKTFKACLACHSVNKGGANKIGPALWNIVGREIAADGSFAYSKALKAKSDGKWTYESLNQFIYRPRTFAKGTKMSYAGLRNDGKRAALIAWLRQQADNPAPLP